MKKNVRRFAFCFLLFFSLGFFVPQAPLQAQTEEASPTAVPAAKEEAIQVEGEYSVGAVKEILKDDVIDIGGFKQPFQLVKVEIADGPDQGKLFEHEYQLSQSREDREKLKVGEKVVVVKVTRSNDKEPEFFVAEKYRLNSVYWVFFLFFALAIFFGRKKGFSSIIGLAFSLLIIVKFIIPQIGAGHSPLLISLAGGLGILFVSLYVAHGFNKRTHIAMVGTAITLALSTLFALWSVSFAKLFGLGSEDALSLLQGPFAKLNFQGLLLGGILIGTLGLLDDITTAQSAIVQELHQANPSLTIAELYKRGLSVGKEHISSLVNTLALAYAGASLPALLVFAKADYPLWVILNSEYLAEEIIRTLVGSAALILAVPITTIIAAYAFVDDPVKEGEAAALHGHHH